LRRRHQVLPIDKGWARLYAVEQVRMVAYLLELHEHVEQLDLFRAITVDHVDVAGKYVFVKLLLDGTHPQI